MPKGKRAVRPRPVTSRRKRRREKLRRDQWIPYAVTAAQVAAAIADVIQAIRH